MANKFDEFMGNIQDPMMRGLFRVAEGIPGSITALSELVKVAIAQRAAMSDLERKQLESISDVPIASEVISMLDKLDIHGENVWICYKDICNFNAEYFLLRLRNGKIAKDLAKLPYARYNIPTMEGNV